MKKNRKLSLTLAAALALTALTACGSCPLPPPLMRPAPNGLPPSIWGRDVSELRVP